MSYQDCIEKSKLMRMILEQEATELSYQTQFVKRRSKLSGGRFAQMLVLGSLQKPKATLNDFVQCGADLGVSITEAGLQQRLTEEAIRFLHQLLMTSLKCWSHEQALPSEALATFTQVNILDSTHLQLPAHLAQHFAGYGAQGGGQAAILKVHLSLDYLHGHLNAIEWVEGKSPDQNCDLHVRHAHAGSLNVFDLGYFKTAVFVALDEQKAFFVSRLQSQTALFDSPTTEQAFDLLAVVRQQAHQTHTFSLYLGRKERLPVRIVCEPLPPQVIEERRRKVRKTAKRQGRTCSSHCLEWQAWNIFMTNLSEAQLATDKVRLLYRVRWQIELVFKLWKSQAGLDLMGHWGLPRLLCQFYAHLIGLVLFHWFSAPYRLSPLGELSSPKAFRVLQRYALRLVDCIAAQWQGSEQMLEYIARDFLHFALKDPRKKSLSTLSLLSKGLT